MIYWNRIPVLHKHTVFSAEIKEILMFFYTPHQNPDFATSLPEKPLSAHGQASVDAKVLTDSA